MCYTEKHARIQNWCIYSGLSALRTRIAECALGVSALRTQPSVLLTVLRTAPSVLRTCYAQTAELCMSTVSSKSQKMSFFTCALPTKTFAMSITYVQGNEAPPGRNIYSNRATLIRGFDHKNGAAKIKFHGKKNTRGSEQHKNQSCAQSS